MRKLFLPLALIGMFFIFTAGLANCPVVQQPNNLCDELVYGSDDWRDCTGMYGSDGNAAEPTDSISVESPSVDPGPSHDGPTDDDCQESPR